MHWAQVPPPPQAEGIKMPSADKVFNRVPPGFTVGDLSSFLLINILTAPWGNNFDSAKVRTNTRSRITPVNTNTLDKVISIICL
tara:strand:- start:1454 stop:1705 length:252 start_codon:yes stop_codon:yes gene_type:complete